MSRLKSTAGGTYPHIARRGFTDSKATDVTPRGPFQFAASFTPDGQTRFYVHEDAHSQGDILRIDMKTRKSSAVLTGNASQIDPAVSPDGKWLTFSSDGAGEREVYLMNLAGETRPIRLSRNGSRSPQWRADGREIVYRTSGGTLISAVPGPSGQWEDATTHELFHVPDLQNYAILPDGQSFLVQRGSPGPSNSIYHVVLKHALTETLEPFMRRFATRY